ncbi:MAG: DUF3422 domain-containing protein [Alphaproteobacteria bacterium]|nr:DUF3422 domain-containing protein [Alphaproteobacteria bacterium]
MGKPQAPIDKHPAPAEGNSLELSQQRALVNDGTRKFAFPQEHPLRFSLTNELHARPFEMLTPPVQASMYATVLGEGLGSGVYDHLKKLCERHGVNPPHQDMNHFTADFGPFRLRFERHTEFASYTVLRHGPFDVPFEKPASDYLPRDWLESMPGQVLVATHMAILPVDGPDPEPSLLSDLFVPESQVTSILSGNSAKVWTDLRIHGDGHNRILIKPYDLPPAKAGRVAQRLLEVAAYRNFALLGLPAAREVGPELTQIDGGLAKLTAETAALVEAGPDGAANRESELLIQLMQLSAEIERLNSRHSYRFSASRAYFALVRSRLTELREERVEGYQTIQEFLDRRLGPAMRTCESVEDRMADMSRRASRAANLLRTRVDFMLERQNQGLLSSMDRRAKMQLRLQQTVEGLSVAAITYYAVGLVGYAAKGLAEFGVPIYPPLVQGVAVPVIAIAVWLGLRQARKHSRSDD